MGGTVRVQGADATANSGALAKSLVVLAAPGRLFSVSVWNESADRFIQLHDAASLPANGTVPKLCFNAPGSSEKARDYVDGGSGFNHVSHADTHRHQRLHH
jgi:hypothetical protein